ncbi:flagellar hook-length control protein FliK [Clostridium sp.]|uniref:flagellar hook-length control protein FliK n=1 Tax=Clostridium sp. TaxID=1506 RepID=UPI002FC6454F
MDISNLDFATTNNINSKNKFNKSVTQSKDNFSKVLQEKTNEKSSSKIDDRHAVEEKPTKNKEEANLSEATDGKKTVSSNESNTEEKKVSANSSEENNLSSEEKVALEGSTKNSSEVNKDTDTLLLEYLNLNGIDLANLINNLQLEPEVKEELKSLVQALISNGELKVNKQDIKSNPLLALMKKVEDATIDGNFKSQIASLLKETLSESRSVAKNIEQNNVNNSSNENSVEKDLIDRITSRIKNTLVSENNVAERYLSSEPQSNVKSLNNNFVNEHSKNGVSQNNLLENRNFTKENGILEKFIDGDKSDSKIDRVSSLMNSISGNRFELNNVSEVNKAPVYISKSTFNEDVIKAIKFMDVNSIKDLSVKIYPKELGEVLISVTMEQGALKAVIKATNKDAVDILNLGLRDINEKLNLNNVKIESVDIGLYKDDTTYFSSGSFEQQQQASQEFKEKTANKSYTSVDEEQNTEETVNDSAVNLLV